jgi:hypothetical protein
MYITDVDNKRPLRIDGKNKQNPDSVFISGARNFCIEVDRRSFVASICKEFGLAPSSEEGSL